MDFTQLQHAYGRASDLDALLSQARDEASPAALAAVGQIRARIHAHGSLYTATAPALVALSQVLSPNRGEVSVAIARLLSDVLTTLRPHVQRARAEGDDSPLLACDTAFFELTPTLLFLRDTRHDLLRAWVVHLLARLPTPVIGFETHETARLETEDHPVVLLTSAMAVADDHRLTSWVAAGGSRAPIGAMVWARTRGNPRDPASVSDEVYTALLNLAAGPRWDAWDAAPVCQHGFHADLATCLLLSGTHRAATSIWVMVSLLESGEDPELQHIAKLALQLIYRSSPYPGAPEQLTALQRNALQGIARNPRVWALHVKLAIPLSELRLPLNADALLRFLDTA